MKIVVSFALLTLIFLSGCAGNPSLELASQVMNSELEQEFAPYRLMTKPTGKTTSKTTVEWAGTSGTSRTTNAPLLISDIFKAIKSRCGLVEPQLIETRIFKHGIHTSYEVWVFNDPLSERDDHTSALSLVMTQLPKSGGVDFTLYGLCHSRKPPILHSSQ